jgi:soluble lytic murein transglycosylase-like protein
MYAKSMIEYVQVRAVVGKWSRHLGLLPAAMALSVAVLPFTLQPNYVNHANQLLNQSAPDKSPGASGAGAANPAPVVAESPFTGLVLANVVTAPKRMALPLDAQQRAVAGYITRKYGVSAELVQEFVRTAFAAGKQYGVDPLLVVAMMAVESGYNPIAESWAGAKGLMQIIPKYHPEKFVEFGGEKAVFDPRVNILVGARIVREYLLNASGDLFTALQTYAGALADRDSVYTHRVLNEKDQLDALAGFPKTERTRKIVIQVDPLRPGTLVIPAVPTLVPVPQTAATPDASPMSPVPPAPSNAKPMDDAAQTMPAQPKQPTAAAPVNLTQLERDVARF